MEIPKFAAVAAAAGLAFNAGCGSDQPSHNESKVPPQAKTHTTAATTPYRFPEAVDATAIVRSVPVGKYTYEHGVRADNYNIPAKYRRIHLDLWGLVQYCTPDSSLVQETVFGYNQRTYTDKAIQKTADMYQIVRNIYHDSSWCENGAVDPSDGRQPQPQQPPGIPTA